MSEDKDNLQKNIPKSFENMANALGISAPEFDELLKKKESVSTENLSNFSMEIEDNYSIGLSQ